MSVNPAYWYDSDPVPPLIDRHDVAMAEVRRMRRATSPAPILAVITNYYEWFQRSALFKCCSRTGLIHPQPFTALSEEQLAQQDTQFILWQTEPEVPKVARKLIPPTKRIINSGVRNLSKATGGISKRTVQSTFANVAGYELRVDPKTYDGYAVIKSLRNGAHDGRVIRLPVSEPDPGSVYETKVRNYVLAHSIFDIRLVMIRSKPALAYVKFRERHIRFQNLTTFAGLAVPIEVLNETELDICSRFCTELGMDYGEIDVLRDVDSNRIYIVDANNTPVGPPKSLSVEERSMAIRLITAQFLASFFGESRPDRGR